MVDLIYKDESYKIIGCCYEVFNNLGPGLREKSYHQALEKIFLKENLPFQSQLYIPLKIEYKIVGKYFLDFLVWSKIAVEIKAGNHFYRKDIDQLFSYLKSKDLKLGLLINFAQIGVLTKRVLNIR